MRVRSELAYALHIHASRVLLLAIKTPSDMHRDNLLSVTGLPVLKRACCEWPQCHSLLPLPVDEDSLRLDHVGSRCINIAAHKEDVRSKQDLATSLAPAIGTAAAHGQAHASRELNANPNHEAPAAISCPDSHR